MMNCIAYADGQNTIFDVCNIAQANLGEVLDWNMGDLDSSLEVFYEELKEQGLWDNVTIITVSDFARTLTSNGLGTDHAWGGE